MIQLLSGAHPISSSRRPALPLTPFLGPYLIVITKRRKVGLLFPNASSDLASSIALDTDSRQRTFWQVAETEILPCGLKKNLSNEFRADETQYLDLLGQFLATTNLYFSYDYDLTRPIQQQFMENGHLPFIRPHNVCLKVLFNLTFYIVFARLMSTLCAIGF